MLLHALLYHTDGSADIFFADACGTDTYSRFPDQFLTHELQFAGTGVSPRYINYGIELSVDLLAVSHEECFPHLDYRLQYNYR